MEKLFLLIIIGLLIWIICGLDDVIKKLDRILEKLKDV